MPSPIGHSLAGYAIYLGTNKTKSNNWKFLFMYILAANFPDIDFIPGFILGTPNRFHHGISHSIGLTLIFGVVLSLIVSTNKKYQLLLKNTLIFGGIYFSHIFFDFFSLDATPPIGEKILWPLSVEYYNSSFILFLDIKRNISSNSEFVKTLFNLHNLMAIALEIGVMLPVIGLIYFSKGGLYKNDE